MKIYKEGDKSKGICTHCKGLVNTTFKYADLKYEQFTIPGVLQDFCDICESPVSIPLQSSYRIREFRENNLTQHLDFRLPQHLTDVLLSIGSTHKITTKPNLLFRLIADVYFKKKKLSSGNIKKRIKESINDELFNGKSKDRISCLLTNESYVSIIQLTHQTKLDKSTIAKGLIITAKHDILDREDKALSDELDQLAATVR